MGLSGYKYSKKDEYKLYYRNYVYLKTDCRSSIKEYYEINNNIDNI